MTSVAARRAAVPRQRTLPTPPETPSTIDVLLEQARDQLGLPVAFLSRFVGDQRELRAVSSAVPLPVGPGFREPLSQTHCRRIADGTMPAVVPDVASTPSARDGIPSVEQFGIGAFAGVPVRLPDGTLYGTLCCLGFAPESSLHERDERTLSVLASAVGVLLVDQLREERARQQVLDRIDVVLDAGGPEQVFQPIWRLDDGALVGHETLSRFPAPDRSVEQWFVDAAEVGRGTALDLSVLRRALTHLPEVTGYLAVNVSALSVGDPRLAEALADTSLDRVVLEVTEHEAIQDYDRLAECLAPLRARGLRLAVDDAGAGYASLRHVLALLPEIIKVDRSLVDGVHTDTARQALVVALVAFAAKTGATLIAEGIELPEQLDVLRRLEVEHGQGFLLGRPRPLPS